MINKKYWEPEWKWRLKHNVPLTKQQDNNLRNDTDKESYNRIIKNGYNGLSFEEKIKEQRPDWD
jgi:hypothetical protein